MLNSKSKRDEFLGQNFLARFELILQSIKEGVCVVDSDIKISFANDSAAKMLGWNPRELISQPFEPIFFGQETRNETTSVNPIHFVLSEGETIHVNAETFYRQDKTNFLVEYKCVPLKENNQIVGAVITFEDISERRDFEEAFAKARDLALEAAREKANFLANMSHEIRTPLNGIIGVSEILAETNLSIGQKDYLETLKTSAHLLFDIVNDILDFSRIEAGKLELEEVDFDLREVVAKTIKLFVPQAFKRRNKLEFEIEETVETHLCGDAGRLRQVLQNLISNAIKFTEDGQVLLKISAEQDNVLRFEVSDTGIGIELDKQSKIFEPFAQADASTTRQFGGTGLGLAISKQIVEMMGGEIGVESEIGKGSRFWFTARFSGQQAILEDCNKEIEDYRIDKNNIKILVVEDNPINQEVALGRLQQFGITADVVENVEAVKEKKYDLILMDCRMPKMDGFEATRKIRRLDGEAKNIKIIAMTASVKADERQRCFEAGMNDYLAKPMTVEVLGKSLERHLPITVSIKKPKANANIKEHPLAKIIDEKTLKNFIEIEGRGEKNFAREMLNLFLKHFETQISELKSSFANRNLELVKNKAHALRGSSGNIGLTELFQAFAKLEGIVDNDWALAEKILDGILERFLELKTKVSHLSEFGD
jgi:PAS domain S-box-containing protein